MKILVFAAFFYMMCISTKLHAQVIPQCAPENQNFTMELAATDSAASVIVPQSIIDALTTFSSSNRETTLQIARFAYDYFDDDFDFIFLTLNRDSSVPVDFGGRHYGVKNSIEGIGTPIFSDNVSFGSQGKLLGVELTVHFGLAVIPHEIMHNFANDVIDTDTRSHWGVSSVGGVLGGFKSGTLETIGANLYTAKEPSPFSQFRDGFGTSHNSVDSYSDLELYLMGLVESDSVEPIMIAINPGPLDYTDPEGATFTADGFDEITIEEIIASHGPRIPGVGQSQKEFKALVLAITTEPLSSLQWAELNLAVRLFESNTLEHFSTFDITDLSSFGIFNRIPKPSFYELTSGLAEISLGSLSGSLSCDADISSVEFSGHNCSDTTGNVCAAYMDAAFLEKEITEEFVVVREYFNSTNSQDVVIQAHFSPEVEDIGAGAEIIVLVSVDGLFFNIDETGNIRLWNGDLGSLAPIERVQSLTEINLVDVYNGSLGGFTGEIAFFLAYKRDGEDSLNFTPEPIVLTVTE